MHDPLIVVAAIAILAVVYVLLPVFMDVFSRFRGDRMVTCPHKKQQAAVQIDAEKAALMTLIGTSKLQVKDCPLWDDEVDCHQECLNQI